MKKTLLSACLAASLFSACSQETSVSPMPPVSRAQPPVIIPSKDPIASRTPHVVVPDAGSVSMPEEIVEVDVLSLAHEHRGRVDHLARAQTLREEGDLLGALTEVRRALSDLPDDEEVLMLIGRLGKKAGERESAAEAFARLARIHPDDAMPLVQQARMLLALGRYEEATKIATSAAERDTTNPEAFQALGRAHLGGGDLKNAIASFEKVIELAPQHGHALNNLGFACLRANENERAMEVLTKAAELLPHVAYVHNNLGVALQRLGKAEEAKLAFAQATSLSPKYVKARINLERVAAVATASELTTDTGADVTSDLSEPVDVVAPVEE